MISIDVRAISQIKREDRCNIGIGDFATFPSWNWRSSGAQ